MPIHPSPLILLASDVPDHCSQYERALKAHHFRVALVDSGNSALHTVKTLRPACAVLDERLPGMTGWDVCKQLKSDRTTNSIPVILLTQLVSKAAAGSSVESGCTAWMAHPSAAQDLVRAVNYVLATEQSSPSSPEDALLGVRVCTACGSEDVSATLRMKDIQYYRCRACGFSWRIDVPAAEPA